MTEAYAGDGVLANSAPFDGLRVGKEAAKEGIGRIIDWLAERGIGEKKVTYRLRDWLISRQRYWGTPFPVVYCDACGIVAVRDEDLPVELPADVDFLPTGQSPLKMHEGFLHTTCPTCGGPARRETDTMDTFMDSSWYWFRYLSPHLDTAPLDSRLAGRLDARRHVHRRRRARHLAPALRALLHQGAARPGPDRPRRAVRALRNQGMILGEDGEKMSKSRGNVANPDHLVASYGADAVRAYLMFIGPWDQGGPWNYQGIEGVTAS
jgi:leucyl-tRNA synthetase